MTFAVDPEVAAVLEALAESSGPLPAPPPVGEIESRHSALNAMLEQANNVAQPIASEVEIIDYEVTAADGTGIRAVLGEEHAQGGRQAPSKLQQRLLALAGEGSDEHRKPQSVAIREFRGSWPQAHP
jgi:hypothetical protein